MHPITILSLLTALTAASPINSPRNPDSAPAAAINKRLANSPWIWLKKAESEQFEDDDHATDNGAVAPANEKVKRFEASVPWIWRPKKVDFEQFEDDAAADTSADAAGEGKEGERE